ncbi:MAG: fructose-bisphosphate aldolase class I [Gammaproteobacteria bacterium]|nr:fructose-bisphosphate aldolase class I [Gammaproteobacteria bacterium]
MNRETLSATARAMVAPGKGILAMDESHPTCKKRFDALGIEFTEENRRTYRDMLVTAAGLGDHVGGAILFDETLRQKLLDDTPFPEHLNSIGIVPGIKVDKGAKDLAGHPGEKVTEGLDGLRERLVEYAELGARFAKWRAVITIGEGLPSEACLEANAHALARYAALCQEADLVPIVEPEVLMNGEHDIDRSYEVTVRALEVTFDQLARQGVWLEGIVLKPSMVISGDRCAEQADVETVAARTMECLKKTVPAEVPGIAFLSGGQSDEEASAHLNAINQHPDLPWAVTFSYGRALQQQAMKSWGGAEANRGIGQAAISKRARLNGAAARGAYDVEMEKAA